MNYYRRYMGDFQADTMSLSMMEQGAYDRLLDYYYATEKPIPLNSDRAAIICRAVTMEERAALEMVLDTYFVREADGWHNARADKEIALANTKIGQARENGKLGGRPKKTKEQTETITEHETNGLTETGTENEPRNNHPPTTNHQPNTTTPLSANADDYSLQFLEFWQTWPKSKRKIGKYKSFELWRSLKLDRIAPRVIAHVEASKRCQQWREGFEPMPETYLRNRRWDDDMPEAERERMVI